eukprot:756463-Hanusia_phi.AAC.2
MQGQPRLSFGSLGSYLRVGYQGRRQLLHLGHLRILCEVVFFCSGSLSNLRTTCAPLVSFSSRDELVYLTADSENCLDRLDPSKVRRWDVSCSYPTFLSQVYVVGGLVDRNKHKGASLERALQLRVSHARSAVALKAGESLTSFVNYRLPISEHMEMSACKAITVDQTVCLLALVSSGQRSDGMKRVIYVGDGRGGMEHSSGCDHTKKEDGRQYRQVSSWSPRSGTSRSRSTRKLKLCNL